MLLFLFLFGAEVVGEGEGAEVESRAHRRHRGRGFGFSVPVLRPRALVLFSALILLGSLVLGFFPAVAVGRGYPVARACGSVGRSPQLRS